MCFNLFIDRFTCVFFFAQQNKDFINHWSYNDQTEPKSDGFTTRKNRNSNKVRITALNNYASKDPGERGGGTNQRLEKSNGTKKPKNLKIWDEPKKTHLNPRTQNNPSFNNKTLNSTAAPICRYRPPPEKPTHDRKKSGSRNSNGHPQPPPPRRSPNSPQDRSRTSAARHHNIVPLWDQRVPENAAHDQTTKTTGGHEVSP